MISLAEALDHLVKEAQYDGYFGHVRVNPESYAGLTVKWKDGRALPTYDDLLNAVIAVQALRDAQEADRKLTDTEFKVSFLNKKSFDEISTYIDNVLSFPDKTTAHDSINALAIPEDARNVLLAMADTIIEEGNFLKLVARYLAAALKKSGYIA